MTRLRSGAYTHRSLLKRAWDWLRGSRTVIGVDVARGPHRTIVTCMHVRLRRDGVRVVEAFDQYEVGA